MRSTSIVVVAIAVAVVLVLGNIAKPPRAVAQIVQTNSRKVAPAFSLVGASGASIKLADYKGKVVLLNFWATWCHGCKTEIPWYIEFQEKYKSRGFIVLGASMDDGGWKVVKPFVKEKKLNYPVAIANDDLAKQYELGAMPLSVLIDRRGRIADSHGGVVDRSGWEVEIQKLLEEEQ